MAQVCCWMTFFVLVYLTQYVYTSEQYGERGRRQRGREYGVGREKREGGEGGVEEDADSSSTTFNSYVPDLSVVYEVIRSFPGKSGVTCITEESPSNLTSSLVPPRRLDPVLKDRGWMVQVTWRNGMTGLPAARGVVCVSAAAPLYPVSFPLMSREARLVPEFLSYTISVGEDLRVRLRGGVPRAMVWWQREPLERDGWKQANLTDDAALLVPATMLSGSGFYSVMNEDKNENERGTLSLVVRDCPAHLFGDDCRYWCPDCMHGGVCHPRSGVCVCPEGVMGRNCEKRCEEGKGRRDCSGDVLYLPGRSLCRPSPVPCLCLPGYTGPRCNAECPSDKWGSDCAQDCRLRCAGDCDGFTGECDDKGPSQCAGGDVGLPRLRQAPQVLFNGSEATVEFSEWREGYDDGDATPWDTLTHVVRLTTIDSTNKSVQHFITSGPRYRLTNLTPATQYEVMVLVEVEASREGMNVTCVADGTGRERVHKVSFTTPCPQEIPKPEISDIVKTSDTSILVRWKPISFPSACHLKYHLTVTPEAQANTSLLLKAHNVTLTATQTEVQGLEANVKYSIRLLASSVSSSSPSASTSLQIHQMSVGQTDVGIMVVVVLLLTTVVTVVIWRRLRRRRRSRRSRKPQPENTTHIPVPTDEEA